MTSQVDGFQLFLENDANKKLGKLLEGEVVCALFCEDIAFLKRIVPEMPPPPPMLLGLSQPNYSSFQKY